MAVKTARRKESTATRRATRKRAAAGKAAERTTPAKAKATSTTKARATKPKAKAKTEKSAAAKATAKKHTTETEKPRATRTRRARGGRFAAPGVRLGMTPPEVRDCSGQPECILFGSEDHVEWQFGKKGLDPVGAPALYVTTLTFAAGRVVSITERIGEVS